MTFPRFAVAARRRASLGGRAAWRRRRSGGRRSRIFEIAGRDERPGLRRQPRFDGVPLDVPDRPMHASRGRQESDPLFLLPNRRQPSTPIRRIRSGMASFASQPSAGERLEAGGGGFGGVVVRHEAAAAGEHEVNVVRHDRQRPEREAITLDDLGEAPSDAEGLPSVQPDGRAAQGRLAPPSDTRIVPVGGTRAPVGDLCRPSRRPIEGVAADPGGARSTRVVRQPESEAAEDDVIRQDRSGFARGREPLRGRAAWRRRRSGGACELVLAHPSIPRTVSRSLFNSSTLA